MRKFSSFLHFIKRIAVGAMVVSSPCTVFAQEYKDLVGNSLEGWHLLWGSFDSKTMRYDWTRCGASATGGSGEDGYETSVASYMPEVDSWKADTKSSQSWLNTSSGGFSVCAPRFYINGINTQGIISYDPLYNPSMKEVPSGYEFYTVPDGFKNSMRIGSVSSSSNGLCYAAEYGDAAAVGNKNLYGGSLLFSKDEKYGSFTSAEGAYYDLNVNESNCLLTICYLYVATTPDCKGDHAPSVNSIAPSFDLSVLFSEKNGGVDVFDDNNGVECGSNILSPCEMIGEQYYSIRSSSGSVFYRGLVHTPWTTAVYDLSKYLGRTIRIMLRNHDCVWNGVEPGGHFGYLYFAARTQPIKLNVKYCKADEPVRVEAPAGLTYEWYGVSKTGSVSLIDKALVKDNYLDAPSAADLGLYEKVRCVMSLTDNSACGATLDVALRPANMQTTILPSLLCSGYVQLKDSTTTADHDQYVVERTWSVLDTIFDSTYDVETLRKMFTDGKMRPEQDYQMLASNERSVITHLNANGQWIRLNVRLDGGCEASAFMFIKPNPVPKWNLEVGNFKEGEPVKLVFGEDSQYNSLVSTAPTSGPYYWSTYSKLGSYLMFEIDDSDSIVVRNGNSASVNLGVLAPGAYNYSYQVTDKWGCKSTGNCYIVVDPIIPLDTFKLSAIAINGNVEGVGLYTFGSTAELVAIPDSGYLFDHWSNGETTASIKVDVKSDSTFTAYFYKNAVWGSGKSDIDLHAFRMDGTELMPGENICPDEVYSFEVKYLNNGEKCKVVVKSLDDEIQTLSEDVVADGKKEALFFLKPVGRKADNWRIFVVKDGLTLTSVDATVSYEAIPSIGIKAFANDRELMADSLNTVDLCEYEPLLLKTVASNPDSINIWRWTNRDTGRVYVPQLKVEPLQSFRVEATTIGGCKAKADINVRLNKQPVLFINGVSKVCVGSDFQLQVNGADSYLWLDYDSLSTDVVKAHADSAGYKVFVVEGVSKEGCRSMVEYAVEYVAVPNFRINTEGANVCEGGVAYLSVDAEQQDYAYEWFGGTSVFDKRAITVPCDSAGSYGYVVRVTDKNGCQSSDSAVVRVYNNPRLFVANDGYDVVCEGYDVVLNGASDFADEMYWTTASGDSVPGAFYGGPSFASQTYTLHGLKHYENNVTCSSVADFTVKVQPNPTFEVVGNLSVCPGDSVRLEAVSKKDEKLQFFWPNQKVKGAVLTDLISGNEDEYTSKKYFVEATSDFGCRAFTEVEVTSLPINKITIETDPDVVYVGESVSLVAYSENAVSYNWGNDGVGSVINTVVEEEREFNVEVTDANGCKSRASYVVKPRLQNTRYWDIYTYVEGEGEVLGGGSYAEGNDAVLIAIPAKGYHFVRWNNGVTSDTLIMVVRNDEKISALFAIDSFKLETVAENGMVFGAGVYEYGWEVILKATPDSGYIFDKWSTGEKEQEIVVRVVSDTTITAYFYKLDEFKVDALAENGTVKGTGYYKIGDRVNLYAVPDPGYHFLYWGDRTTVDSLSFTVTGDTLFFAYFGKDSVAGPAEEKIPVDVLVRYPIGQGAVDGAGTYSKGDTIVLIAKPEYGYHFDTWSNGSTDDTLLAVVVSDTTFEAYFAPDTFKVEGIAEMGGKVIGGGQFTYRDTVYMVAIPDTGYVFGGWSNGSISDTIAVITEKDQSITAYFHKEGDVKVDVIADNGSAGGIGYYPVGDSIALVAKADTGYHFVRWENGSTDDTLYISVKNDTVIKAYFEPDTFMVTLKMEGFGLLLGEGEYAYGDTAKLVAAPIEGYIFSKWSTGDTTNLLNHVVTGDTTITAYFMKALGDIKVDVIAENGSAGGVGMYSKGDTVVLVAKPDTNYHFTHWGNGWTKDTLYLTVKSDTVIYAYFAIDSFKVVSGCVNGGIAGVGVYPYGTTVALLAMPDSNYIFERWENGDTTATTRIVVTNDTVVTAYFYHKNSVYVDVLAEHGTVNGAGHYMVGDTISLSVQADWGYKFIGWDNGSTSDTLQLVVAGDSMVTALFRLDSFSIKAYCNNGAVLIAGPMTYVYGDTATLSVKPNEGYVLYNWSTGDTTPEIKVAILSDTVVVAYCYKEGFYPVSAVATNGIVNGVGDYEIGSVAHIEAEAVEGFHFVKWMHGDTVAAIDTTVNSPIVLYPVFEQDTFKVELEVVGNGTVSGEGYYPYGEVASIKATATDSSIFVRWSDGSTEEEREIKIKSDTMLTASFRDKQRVVISPEIDTTYGTIEGTGEYLEGDTIVLVIKPIDNDSVKFVGWSDGDTSTHKTVVVGVDDDVYPVFEKVNTDNTVIPNAFTPVTKDGINDHFMKGYEVRIFNRYQQLVHEGNDGWDGMYRGEFAEAGTYFYVVTMKDGRVHRGPVELVVFK